MSESIHLVFAAYFALSSVAEALEARRPEKGTSPLSRAKSAILYAVFAAFFAYHAPAAAVTRVALLSAAVAIPLNLYNVDATEPLLRFAVSAVAAGANYFLATE